MGSNAELLILLKERQVRRARDCFLTYRKMINPKSKWGWFQEEVATELQVFFDDMVAGKRPKLVIQAPPQHGKSVQIIDFISWLAGKNPSLRTIYTSFSERLGIRANLKLQRLYDSAIYHEIFPETCINKSNSVTVSGQFMRNREILEYVNQEGFFRNTTVRGSITGESLDLGVIDDPIRGRADANSEAVRDAAWNWFTDDFFTRFSEDAGLLVILTRWHLDDPVGRLVERYPDVKVLSYAAIAVKDEKHRKIGEALFPEHKSIDFLQERKKLMDDGNWQALYQQMPVMAGGNLFKTDEFRFYEVLPKLKWRGIWGDTALKTKEQNDYSVFQCWGESMDGQAVLIDQIRGKWEAPELLTQARAFWTKHKGEGTGTLRSFNVEDKASGTGLIQTLKKEGIPILGIQRSIDKITRAMDAIPLIQSGNVLLPKHAPWLSDYLSEFAAFPNGSHDDQIDPTMDAIDNVLNQGKRDWRSML
jgi:predicted phage terminase large subunit-like protein